jgi:DNA-binding NarL/FixJ family response regulator
MARNAALSGRCGTGLTDEVRPDPAPKYFASGKDGRCRTPEGIRRESQGQRRQLEQPLRIVLVDEDEGVHNGLREMIRARGIRWTLDGCSNGRETLKRLPQAPPTLVLMGVWTGRPLRNECMRKLHMLLPNLPIVVFTPRGEAGGVLSAILAGASGYITRPIAAEGLRDAVVAATEGSLVLGEQVRRPFIRSLHDLGASGCFEGLSERQREILLCLTHGLQDREIGQSLGIETNTVNAHLKRLFKKLGVHSRGEAVRIASGPRLGG